MNDARYLVLLLVFAMGCNSDTDLAHMQTKEKPTLTRNQREASSVVVSQQIKPPVPDQSFAEILESLTQQAARLEKNLEFESAFEVWKEIYHEVEMRFPSDSWRVNNARVGKAFAEMACGFSETQRSLYRDARRLNEELATLLDDRDYEMALDNATKSLGILKQLTGEASANVGRQMLQIAVIKDNLGQVAEAAEDFLQGMQLLNELGFGVHPEIELAHSALAAIYSRTNQFPLSIASQKRATRMAGQLWGQQSTKYAGQANQLGVIYQRAGESELALKILRGSEAVRRLKLGPDSMEVGHSRLNIGIVLMDMKNFPEALENIQMAERVFRLAVPRQHQAVVQCQTKMATIHMMQEQYVMAERFLKSAVDELKQVGHVMPSQRTAVEYRLAIALGRQGKYDQAQPLLEGIIEAQQAELGSSHPMTLRSLKAYSLVLKQSGQLSEAKRVNDRIQRIAEAGTNGSFIR